MAKTARGDPPTWTLIPEAARCWAELLALVHQLLPEASPLIQAQPTADGGLDLSGIFPGQGELVLHLPAWAWHGSVFMTAHPATTLPDPPYPATTASSGVPLPLAIEDLSATAGWQQCPAPWRPWLVMTQVVAWTQTPCGSLPGDPATLANLLGCPPEFLTGEGRVILADWQLHSDGRLYHPLTTAWVQELLTVREKWRRKKQRQRARARCQTPQVASESPLPPAAPAPEASTTPAAPAENPEPVNDVQTVPAAPAPAASAAVQPPTPLPDASPIPDVNLSRTDPPTGYPQPLGTVLADLLPHIPPPPAARDRDDCPHQEIIALYHQILPELPIIVLSRWRGSQSEIHLRARWREDPRHRDLRFWERFFKTVRTNPHWMGHNQSGWQANLRWLVKRENFTKVVERMVDQERRRLRS